MRILILNPFFYPYIAGIEKVVCAHASYLARAGHEVHVVTSHLIYPSGRHIGLPATEEFAPGFTVHRLAVALRSPPWGFTYPSNGGLVIPRLLPTVAAIAPDIVHAHNIGAPAWANAGARYVRQQAGRALFYYTPHHHPSRLSALLPAACRPWLPQNFFYHRLNALPLAIARRVFVLTAAEIAPLQREFPGIQREQISLLPNGVFPPSGERPQVSGGPLVVLFVGRADDPNKGFNELLQAMDFVWSASSDRPVILRVVGRIAAATRQRLESELGNRLVIDGVVSEAALDAAYRAADVFVMPSRYEAFGIPFLEAMRYGVAVVGTQVGGIPQVVPPGTGLLVPPGDIAALGEAIGRILRDATERQRLGAKGQQWSQRFHWPAIVGRLEDCYRRDRAGSQGE